MTKDFDVVNEIVKEYKNLESEASSFAKDCLIYEDFYEGDHWRNSYVIFSNGWSLDNSFIEDAIRVIENHCDEVVDTNVEILMNNPPIFRIPKPQEEDPLVDVDPYDEEQDEIQTDQITDIEKILRLILNKSKYHVELEDGACNGSLYGRTIFLGKIINDREYGKIAGFSSIDPTSVRLKFRTGRANEVEKIFWKEEISFREAESRYKEYLTKEELEIFSKEDYIETLGASANVVRATGMADTGWADLAYRNWINKQREINPMINVIHCYDEKYYWVIYKDRAIFKKEHRIGRFAKDGAKLPPVWYIPNAPMGNRRRLGQSDLRRIIPTQILINKYKSLEYNLISGNVFPSKELISMREGLLDAIKGAKSFDIRLMPGESINFKTPNINAYPLQETIRSTKQHLRDNTGMTNAVFGDPEGSINTGPALKIQYHPAERKILRKTVFWLPELKSLYSWLLRITAENNPKFAELIYFNGKPYTYVDVSWEVKTPQDEAVEVTNDINLVDRGIISKESVARKRGVKNVEYEMKKIAIEKMIDAEIQARAKAKVEAEMQAQLAGSQQQTEQPASEEERAQSVALADQENYQMSSGQEVAPTNPADVADFDAHNQEHLSFINSEQFNLLPDGVKDLFSRHLANVQQGGEVAQKTSSTRKMVKESPGPEPVNKPVLNQSQNKKEEQPDNVPHHLRYGNLPEAKRNFK